MKKSLKIVTAALTISIIFCGCERNKNVEEAKVPTFNIVSDEVQEQSKNNKLLGRINDKNIYLYGRWSEEGRYDHIFLKNNDKEQEFDWKGVWKEPELLLADLNSDGKEELVAIITIGYGTGFLQEEIHIINLDTMKEYLVENPVAILESNVKTKLNTNKIVFSVDKESIATQIKPMSKTIEEEYKNLIYGTFLTYYIENNKIKVSVDAKTNPLSSLVDFEVAYKFENGNFIKDKIYFKDYQK